MINNNITETPRRLLSTESCVCQDGRIINTRTHKWEPCPYCERAYKWMKMNEIPVEDKYNSVYDLLDIPKKYRNLSLCGRDYLFSDMSEEDWSRKGFYVESVKNVAEFMFAVSDSIYAGRSFKQSACIYVPKDDIIPDMNKWVYSCIEHGANNGLKVVPYLSLTTLYGLKQLQLYDDNEIVKVQIKKKAGVRMNSETHKKISDLLDIANEVHFSYYGFISADILFLEVVEENDVYITFLADLLASRAALNKPTYVISRKTFHPANYYLTTEKGDLARLSDYAIRYGYKEASMKLSGEKKSEYRRPVNELPEEFKSNVSKSSSTHSGFVESFGKGALLSD